MKSNRKNYKINWNRGKKGNETLQWASCLLFPLVLLYYELILKFLGGAGAGNFFTFLLFTIALGGLELVVYLVLPGRKFRSWYAVIVFAIEALLIGTEFFVGKAFQVYMTLESILTGAGDVAGDFAGSVVITVVKGWYIILLYLLPVVLVWIFRRAIITNKRMRPHFPVLVLICSLLLYLGGNLLAKGDPVYKENYQFDNAVRTFGLMPAMRLEAKNKNAGAAFENTDPNTGEVPESPSAEETEAPVVWEPNTMDIDFEKLASETNKSDLQGLYQWLSTEQGTKQNEYTGLFKGKNLILICAEGFSQYAVSPELTPTLYRLIHNGFYFSDYYQPAWGGSTSTGEYSVLTGLIPTDGVKSIRKTSDHNMYLTIGNDMQRLGYTTLAYHNNSYTYYGRNETHENLGYSKFIGMGNGMEEGVTKTWPESDLEMIDFTVPQFIDQQPFCVYYMTVSGHCGYSFSGNKMSAKNRDKVESVEGSDTIKAYIACNLELEYAMESLIRQLEEAGIADDTVICLSTDHYPYGLEEGDTWGNDKNYLPELYGIPEDQIDQFNRDKNALILWSGCLEGENKDMQKEISYPVYSLDILPTLSNLFGVEYDSRLLAGRDVFADTDHIAIWTNYSWKTEHAVYSASKKELTFYSEESQSWSEDMKQSYSDRIKKTVKNRFTLSKMLLDYDYWDDIFGGEN